MVGVGAALTNLLSAWQFSLPVLALIMLLVAWLAAARSYEPPEFVPRRTLPVLSDDKVSLTFQELVRGDFYSQVISLRASLDDFLVRQHQTTLAQLPRTERKAGEHGLVNIEGWRGLRRDMDRLLALSKTVVRPTGWSSQSRRRRQFTEFEGLVGRVLPKARELETGLTQLSGSGS